MGDNCLRIDDRCLRVDDKCLHLGGRCLQVGQGNKHSANRCMQVSEGVKSADRCLHVCVSGCVTHSSNRFADCSSGEKERIQMKCLSLCV